MKNHWSITRSIKNEFPFGPTSDFCPEPLLSEIDTSVAQNMCSPNVRFGSKSDIVMRLRDVRFTPESGNVQCNLACPLSANSDMAVLAKARKFLA